MSIIKCSLCTLLLAAHLSVVWADAPLKIAAKRIGIDVELIGASGLPLGTVFSVEGMVVVEKARHHKEGDSRFVVIRKIERKSLKTPMRIRLWDDSKVKEGKWIKMTLIEDARYYLAFFPNGSDEDIEEKGRQTLTTGLRIIEAEGADQPATAPESKSEGKKKPKPESEARSQ